MRCIGKRVLSILCAAFLVISLAGCSVENTEVLYNIENKRYNTSVYTGSLYAEDLCVSDEDVALQGFSNDSQIQSAGLFDVSGQKVLYGYHLHDRIYPASITKIMTALLALENGNLDDKVTISSTADSSNFSVYAQVCGLKAGEVWTLDSLLNALMIYSGNDAALAVAEHIGGSVDAFVEMMNERAKELFAVNTNFMNPHGLHNDSHYTTAYDLYLIFNECIKDERFIKIIDQDSCSLTVTSANGAEKTVTFKATNLYANGTAAKPENVTLIGGKTGTTDDYRRCLILLSRDEETHPFISVIIGATDKTVLYRDMTSILRNIP